MSKDDKLEWNGKPIAKMTKKDMLRQLENQEARLEKPQLPTGEKWIALFFSFNGTQVATQNGFTSIGDLMAMEAFDTFDEARNNHPYAIIVRGIDLNVLQDLEREKTNYENLKERYEELKKGQVNE